MGGVNGMRLTSVAAILKYLNDNTAVHVYGDGVLVDLPMRYGDGDGVRLLVEPVGQGYRVTDRGEAADRLQVAGVNLDARRTADALAEVARTAHLDGVGAEQGELSVYGLADELGRMLVDVACASLRVDELRWTAAQRGQLRFQERLVHRVERWAGDRWIVRRSPPIRLRSGRDKRVTLSVESNDSAVYVQALSTSDRESAVQHCYYVFGLSEEVPRTHKIAALDGPPDLWSSAIVSELKEVSEVKFYDDPTGLEHSLTEHLVTSSAL